MVPLRNEVSKSTVSRVVRFLLTVCVRGCVCLKGATDKSTKARKAIFNLREQSADIYLVLKVDKVLTGDHESATEPYFKHATVQLSTSLAAHTTRSHVPTNWFGLLLAFAFGTSR